jgi:hypothetical protein
MKACVKRHSSRAYDAHECRRRGTGGVSGASRSREVGFTQPPGSGGGARDCWRMRVVHLDRYLGSSVARS